MTVNDLWRFPLKEVKKSKVSLSTLCGQTIVVDLSIWLHQIIGVVDEVALFLQTKPAYLPRRLVRELWRRHKVLVDSGLKPIYMFDGRRHSMKVVAREQRDGPQESARKWLDDFYERGRSGATISDEERDKALQKMKDSCVITPETLFVVAQWMKDELMTLFCAPFEAEWQCVSLVLDGIADCILSTDGDCVVLGAPKVVIELTLSTKQCYVYDRTTVFTSLVNKKYDILVNKDYLPEMAAFLGCDYIKRVRGNGRETVFNKVLPGYRNAKDKRQHILGLRGIDESHANRFECVTNLYRHAPILRQSEESGEWKLVPLFPLPNNHMVNWSKMIGFIEVSHPSELLPVESSLYGKAAKFDGCSFIVSDGGPLPAFPEPMYNDNATTLPPFAHLDFELLPVCCQQSDVLHQFVAARHPYALDEKCSRNALEEAVVKVKNDAVLLKDKVPKIIDRWHTSNVLTGVGEDWSKDCIHTIRCLATIDEEKDVRRFYPEGNEANLEHARKLVDGGNILVRESLRHRLCRDNVDNVPRILFQCDAVPHMKGGPNSKVKSENIDGRDKEYYRIFLCFKYDANCIDSRRVIGYPYSCCGCHDGRYFCSHMLALLSVLHLKQMYSEEAFELGYARSPLVVQSMPLLVENLVRRDAAKRKASKSPKASKKQHKAWYQIK